MMTLPSWDHGVLDGFELCRVTTTPIYAQPQLTAKYQAYRLSRKQKAKSLSEKNIRDSNEDIEAGSSEKKIQDSNEDIEAGSSEKNIQDSSEDIEPCSPKEIEADIAAGSRVKSSAWEEIARHIIVQNEQNDKSVGPRDQTNPHLTNFDDDPTKFPVSNLRKSQNKLKHSWRIKLVDCLTRSTATSAGTLTAKRLPPT